MPSNQLTRGLICLLFFLSGISGLVYQIIWTRLLVLVFGNTLFATSTVIASFMAGLAAGSYLLGRWIDRRPRPLLAVYAGLEAAIGLFALAFPWLLDAATPLYMALYRGLEGDLFLLNLVRFSICFGLISIPTFLMGGTLPVLLKRFSQSEKAIGSHTGLLYGLNTAGAVAGTLASGYLLLRTLGMRQTTWIAVAINLGVAIFAWILSRTDSRHEAVDGTTGAESAPADGDTSAQPRAVATAVLIGIGISGFCALAYEVFWIRMLNLFVNNNVYSFTAILATFLTGIALGSLVYASVLSRHRRPVWLFAAIQLGIGLYSLATPFLFSLLQDTLFAKRSEALTLGKTAVLMLGPTILMGIAVPLAVQICQRGQNKQGTSVGNVYAVNTVGAIFGAIAAGFLLLPYAGLQRGLLTVASLNLFAGLLAVRSVVSRRGRLVAASAFVVLVAIAASVTPRTAFRSLYERALPEAEILHYEEGQIANVVVYDMVKNGWKDLFLNGVEEASSRVWHVQLFKMLGMLAPMVHPDPDDALMIAFGAGMSAGACVHQVGTLDCVDLNPDIHEVAEIFSHENLEVLKHPGFNLIENDGRNTLLLSDRQYSMIISDATNPKSFDSWTLYTREFYQLIQDRLRPDGIFCQWVVIPLTGNSIKVILNTFRSVFSHASLWCIYGSTQCMMLGTPGRLEIDYQDLIYRLEPVLETSGLAEYGVTSVEKFLSFFLLGEEGLDKALEGFDIINTDDLPIAQFRVQSRALGVINSADLIRQQQSILPYLTNFPADAEVRLQRLEAYREVARRLNWSFLVGSQLEAQAAHRAARILGVPDDANVASALQFDSTRKKYFLERLEQWPDDINAHNSLAHAYWMEEDFDAAIQHLQRALDVEPGFAVAHFNLGRVLRDAGQYDAATEAFLAARDLSPTSGMLARTKRQLHILDLLRKLSCEPEDSGHRDSLKKAYLDNDELMRAEAVARLSVMLDPADSEDWRFLSRTYERLDFLDDLIWAREHLLAARPGDPQAQSQLSQLREILEDGRRNQEWLNRNKHLQVIEDEENTGASDQHPGVCLQARETWNDAPFHGAIDTAQLRRAAALLSETARRNPGHLHAFIDAARLAEILGDFGAGLKILELALDTHPDNPAIRARVRRLTLLRDLESNSLSAAERPDALLELGGLLRRTGDLEPAIDAVTQSTDVAPADYRSWLELAGLLELTGRYRPAASSLERALRLDPPPRLREQLETKLDRLREIVNREPGSDWRLLVQSAQPDVASALSMPATTYSE